KEALARRKQEGMRLGHVPGDSKQLRVLRANKDAIIQQVGHVPREEIAKMYNTTRNSLYKFLKNECHIEEGIRYRG
ncbi:putative DNA-invertase from lambdoid prophage Rac, partial [termite gut metagenome]